MRYDTRCYFNVRSIANTGQVNLPQGNQQLKSGENRKTGKQKTCMLRNIGKQSEEFPEEEKEGYGGKDLQKRKVLSLE